MRRDPLDKTRFWESNREKWLTIFLLCAGGILAADVIVSGFDPVPYMQFLMASASLFLFGASADSAIKAYSVKSIRETQAKEETKRMTVEIKDDSKPDNQTIIQYKGEYLNDPSYAPLDWVGKQDTTEDFR